MVRRFAAVTAAVLVLAACGDDDEAERPDPSAHPELTAEEILDRMPDDVGGITRIISITSGESIGDDPVREETLAIGENWYTRSDEVETLFYEGELYVRDPETNEWVEPPAELREIGEIFERVGEKPLPLGLETDEGFFDNPMRLRDEIRDGVHLIGVRNSFDESFFSDFQEFFFSAVAEEADRPLPDDLPDEFEGTFDIWVRAEDLSPVAGEGETRAFSNGREVLRTQMTMEVLEDAELPGPLPD